MAKDIQMKFRNEYGIWEELFPSTRSRVVSTESGQTLESELSRLDQKDENLTAQLAHTNKKITDDFVRVHKLNAKRVFHINENFNTISDFDKTGEWTNGTISPINNDMKLKLSGKNVTTDKVLSTPIDFTDKLLYLRFYNPVGNPVVHITVRLMINTGYVIQKDYFVREDREGSPWVEMMFDVNSCEILGSFTTDSLKEINRIEIQMYEITETKTAEISLDFLGYIEKTNKQANFTLSFDDGNKSDITKAKPIMDEYGFKGVSNVIPINIGNASYMTMQDLQTLRDDGWDIAAHNDTYLSTITGQELKDLISTTKQWFHDNGFYEGTIHYVAPAGLLTDEAVKVLKDYGYLTIRSDVHTDPSSVNQLETMPPGNPYKLLPVGIYEDAPSLSDLEILIDKAIENNAWVILEFHGIDGGSVPMSEQKFKAIMKLLHDKGAKVSTLSELAFTK